MITDREPRTTVGNARTFQFGESLSQHCTISAPSSLKVQTRLFGSTVKPAHTTANNVETWRYKLGPIERSTKESLLPSDLAVTPILVVSSLTSWNALATALAARVDAQLAAGPMPAHAGTPRELLDWLDNSVTLDEVPLTAVGPTPKTPLEIMKAGHADDLAFAVAYLALLRQSGITAELALLSIGPSFDVPTEIPCIDDFDRAIIRAHIDNREVWIDPTDDALEIPGLAANTRGRRVLVLSPKTTMLVETPRLTSADSRTLETRTYDRHDGQRASHACQARDRGAGSERANPFTR